MMRLTLMCEMALSVALTRTEDDHRLAGSDVLEQLAQRVTEFGAIVELCSERTRRGKARTGPRPYVL